MAAIKPATPLPWHLDERSICGWLDRGGAIKDVETTVAEVFTGEDRDAAYIVAACNNFPRLVEALRRNHLENVQTAKELGGCDHSVGICQCDMNRMNEETGALLLEIGESA